MSKHTAPISLTARLLEHEAKVVHILTGKGFSGAGLHRDETVAVTA